MTAFAEQLAKSRLFGPMERTNGRIPSAAVSFYIVEAPEPTVKLVEPRTWQQG